MRTLILQLAAFLLLPLFFTAGSAAANPITGAEIIAKIRDHPAPKSSVVKLKMTLTKKRGSRLEVQERVVKIVAKDENKVGKSLLRFASPADIKGVGLLVISPEKGENEQWLYMPSLGKATRISGAQKKGSFMGTDFTYEDLEPRDPDSGTHTLVKEESVDGYKTWVVDTKPKDRKSSTYSRVRQWVRQDIALPVKAEFYDRSGRLLKVLHAEDIHEEGGYWTARKTVMKNIRKKSSTTLEILEQRNDMPIKDEIFTQRMLTRG